MENNLITIEDVINEIDKRNESIMQSLIKRLEISIDEYVNNAISKANDLAISHIRATHVEKLEYHRWIKEDLQMAGIPKNEMSEAINLVKSTFFIYIGRNTCKWCEVELDVIVKNRNELSEAINHVKKVFGRYSQESFI